MKPPCKIIVGLSGGVDSSVAALRLCEQGFTVEGLFMKNWEEDDTDTYCSAAEDVADAQAVCDVLSIPLHTVNFAAEYWDHVFEHFLAEYRAGRTPNPDILCNREIKFKAFLDYARHLGADAIATGHYARTVEQDGLWQLQRPADHNKDQTYFLYTLGQAQLAQSLFPLADLEKPQIRQMAHDAGFPNHAKKDSTGICFIGERKFKTFLNTYLPATPGIMQTPEGEILGEHDGLMFYTLGQREGLKIGGRRTASPEPWYVVGKNVEANQLIVAQGHDHPLLYNSLLDCQQLAWIAGAPPKLPYTCQAKTRYRQAAADCVIQTLANGRAHVTFSTPQRAITPGQSIVFYHDRVCLGGGIIE